jgi:adenylylsulfate kinase
MYAILRSKGHRVERLDGDTVRAIFPQTGFSRQERNVHIERIGLIASILEKNGVIVIASFISPYRESREFVRKLCKNFVEVYVNASLAVCEKRDVKGLYKKARLGTVVSFTGVNDPYEEPDNPNIVVNTEELSIEESIRKITQGIKKFL